MLLKRKDGGHGPSYPWPLPKYSVRRILSGDSELPSGTVFLSTRLAFSKAAPGREGGQGQPWPNWPKERRVYAAD